MIIPRAEGMLSELTIIIASVASHFLSEPFWLVESGVRGGEFNLCHHQTSIVAVKFIDFEGEITARHKPACFVDDTRQTQGEEHLHFFESYFLFPLHSREPIVT